MVTAILIATAVLIGTTALHANAVYVITEMRKESEDKTYEKCDRKIL